MPAGHLLLVWWRVAHTTSTIGNHIIHSTAINARPLHLAFMTDSSSPILLPIASLSAPRHCMSVVDAPCKCACSKRHHLMPLNNRALLSRSCALNFRGTPPPSSTRTQKSKAVRILTQYYCCDATKCGIKSVQSLEFLFPTWGPLGVQHCNMSNAKKSGSRGLEGVDNLM